MLFQLELVRDGHIGRVKMTKHRIDLLQPAIVPVHKALYRAGLETTEFEKANIDMKLAEYIIELVQTEWAVPIVVVPKKDRTL